MDLYDQTLPLLLIVILLLWQGLERRFNPDTRQKHPKLCVLRNNIKWTNQRPWTDS